MARRNVHRPEGVCYVVVVVGGGGGGVGIVCICFSVFVVAAVVRK